MNKRLVFLNILFLSLSIQAQEIIMYPGDIASSQGDWRKAISLYKIAIKENPHDSIATYNLAAMYSKIKEHDSTIYYLGPLLESWNYCVKNILSDPDFYYTSLKPQWREIETIVRRKYPQLIPVTDISTTLELLRMGMCDQAFYKEIEIEKSKTHPDTVLLGRLWKIKDSLNEVNRSKLNQITAKHGFPTISSVGKPASTIAFLIVQHSSLQEQKKYLATFEALAKKGEFDKYNLAMITDRILVFEGKDQVYGSQIHYLKDGKIEVFPIKDERNVNIRRKEMGMEPLEDYLKMYYNVDYVVPIK